MAFSSLSSHNSGCVQGLSGEHMWGVWENIQGQQQSLPRLPRGHDRDLVRLHTLLRKQTLSSSWAEEILGVFRGVGRVELCATDEDFGSVAAGFRMV